MEWLPPGWYPRVVAFDIDGTLTDEKKRLDMHAVEALRRLEDAGIPVILATPGAFVIYPKGKSISQKNKFIFSEE